MNLDLFKQPENVRIEQVNNLFRQSPFLFLGLLASIVIVTLYFWDRAERSHLLVWLFANLLLLAFRVVMIKRYQRLRPTRTAVKWGYLFALTSLLSGMIWGSFPVFLLDIGNLPDVFLLTTIMAGMVAGSLVPMSVFIPTHQLFATFSLLPLIIVTLGDEQPVMASIGIILIIYLLSMYAFALVVNANITESIRLRFENLDLLQDLRAQKEIAEKANTEKSRFLAATSHDLRQPLHAMDLYLGALEGLLDRDEQHELLKKSRRSSVALNELLTALMDISRLDAGEVVINRSLVNLSAILQELYEEYKEQAAQRAIDLQLDMPEQPVFVDTDATMLARMLRNLLNNACSHSHASRIELRLFADRGDAQTASGELVDHRHIDHGQIVVSVCDNGRGIPDHAREQIFSEFYQLNNPERDRSKGLGLGLAIVRRLAALLEHPLQLRSREGEGSCFELSLPQVDAPLDSEQPDETQAMDLAGLFIVLVDDEKEIRSAMRALLRQWGCELLVADSLQSLQAELDALDYPVPDLLLCDYRLREHQTGLEVAAALRRHFQAEVPVIIISGDTSQSIARSVEASGYHMLFKPVAAEALRQAIYQRVHAQTDGTG